MGFKPILENRVLRAVSEPFLLLYGRKTKSAKWHPKECSNQKVEENKLALELNFPSKYTRAGSIFLWFGGISQRALLSSLYSIADPVIINTWYNWRKKTETQQQKCKKYNHNKKYNDTWSAGGSLSFYSIADPVMINTGHNCRNTKIQLLEYAIPPAAASAAAVSPKSPTANTLSNG